MSEENIIDLIDQAHQIVCDLSSGKRSWDMSIPAQPEHDPDLVIGRALRECQKEIFRLRAEIQENKDKSSINTCKE